MSNNQFNLHYEAELNEGIKVTTLSPIFCSGDIEAHSFVVKVMRNGKPVNLAGTTVRGFFIRPDNVTITLEGSVNADGEAVVTLSNACYNKQGRFQLVIRVTMGGVISTVFCGLGGMLLTVTDGFIDEDNVIPSLGDLLAQIDAMKEATAAAIEAADRANEAAENAESGIGYPVVGTVDADKNIDLTGDLAPGTYTLHYTGKDGTKLSQIVTIELTASEGGGDDTGDTGGDDTGDTGNEGTETTYINQIPISKDTDGSVLNGVGYATATRISGSSGLTSSITNANAATPSFTTGFIPVKKGDVIRLKNCWMDSANLGDDESPYGHRTWALLLAFYAAIGTAKQSASIGWTDLPTDTSVVTGIADTDGMYRQFTVKVDYPYMRLNLAAIDPAQAILTVNEEIA